MKAKSRRQPVHPGDYLREELAERGISMNQLARDIRIPMSRVSLIVNGRRGITALRLDHDLAVKRLESADEIAREVIPAKALA